MDTDEAPLYDYKKGATLLVDKPKGWTSFDVVNKVRFKIRHRYKQKKFKVGHAGTLDPLATGLLVLCTGKFTKKLEGFQGQDKTYTGTIMLGGTTPSYDAETEVDKQFPYDHITADMIETTRQTFVGQISQKPPVFSAIKVDGVRLYKKARKGQEVEIKPRSVHIHEFEITRIELPEIDFRVKCSKGTYIRSLAFDFGKALKSGAYLSALRRTQSGPFLLDDAWNLDELVDHIENGPCIMEE